jgi:hypothetical protein
MRAPVGKPRNNALDETLHVATPYLLSLLLATGAFALPQAEAVVQFARVNGLDPCVASWMGEGLFDVAGPLRRALHAEEGQGCVSPEDQVRFLVRHWTTPYYARCRSVFDRGDLGAFRRCWGLGRSR